MNNKLTDLALRTALHQFIQEMIENFNRKGMLRVARTTTTPPCYAKKRIYSSLNLYIARLDFSDLLKAKLFLVVLISVVNLPFIILLLQRNKILPIILWYCVSESGSYFAEWAIFGYQRDQMWESFALTTQGPDRPFQKCKREHENVPHNYSHDTSLLPDEPRRQEQSTRANCLFSMCSSNFHYWNVEPVAVHVWKQGRDCRMTSIWRIDHV